MPVIYGLIDADTMELRYVGRTKFSPEERLAQHRKVKANRHLIFWLNTDPVVAIILEHEPADINEAEICWIREMREQGDRLLNVMNGGAGGGGMLGRKHTAETIEKMCRAQSALSSKLSARLMGNVYGWGNLGIRRTHETRARMRLAQQQRTGQIGRAAWSPETRSAIARHAANVRWGNA